MPTYQYRCTECGESLEAVQSFSEPSLTECPACSGVLRKVFNSVGIVFKGSGFYRNDSRSGPVKADSTSGAKSESTPGSKPEPKSDAKPDSSTAKPTTAAGSSGATKSTPTSGGSTST